MKRREFVFGSLSAAALLSPLLAARRASAQQPLPPRVFFWVGCAGYPDPADFFPSVTPGGTAFDFTLSPILASFEGLKQQMVIVDGVDIAETGFDNGNNHVRTMGKVLTAHDIEPNPSEEGDGVPGGISIDQLLIRDLGLQSMEILLGDRDRGEMRDRPFATGPLTSKAPFVQPADAWNRAFADLSVDLGEAERVRRLQAKKSVLDDVLFDLRRFRRELVGIERMKLDIHEDAIRRAEQSVQRDLDMVPPQCPVPGVPEVGEYIPDRARAHLDVLFSAFACNRIQSAGICWGASGYHWPYEWVPGVDVEATIHDEVHHRDVDRREAYRLAAAWDWAQLAGLCQRMKDTPEGSGTMLDNTLVVAVNHFGRHHSGARIPAVLIGGAQGRLTTGRYLQLPSAVDNGQFLTSVAHLMGHQIAGIGDNPTCGPISEI